MPEKDNEACVGKVVCVGGQDEAGFYFMPTYVCM